MTAIRLAGIQVPGIQVPCTIAADHQGIQVPCTSEADHQGSGRDGGGRTGGSESVARHRLARGGTGVRNRCVTPRRARDTWVPGTGWCRRALRRCE